MSTPVVTFDQASVGYRGHEVLTDVSFSIPSHSMVTLVGDNGAGKSTILKAILGLAEVLRGSVTVDGEHRTKSAQGSVGYVPQKLDAAKDFPITALQVVGLGLVSRLGPFRRLSKADRESCHRALAAVDLADCARLRFGELSGGQQQRVLIARSLVSGPRLLLLDEPFNGLDEAARNRLITLLNELKHRGLAIIASTHDVRLATETDARLLRVEDATVR
ncbi:metal ABC transporter ATP-binding protein [Corynebacterium epidermidicanis]|uniref:ATPase component of Mn/Zn ABC-type transporter n=1 Tax=Corynebacterium epidermidicanis TaxID=1050174 RepID=A0A0G3GPB3_9CORY|nr:ABC transporter ATP-binding protein [Corynebacterium epidermidicanis]AKK02410.1 ATPase component of Mn/Zn ABC-type transporter [Corynebacterium epidermidicanis]